MKLIFRLAIAIVSIGLFSMGAHSQIRQTHLYIDDGHGNFSILSAPSGGGALTLPGSTLIFPAVNASGVLKNDGLGSLTWGSSLTNPMSAQGDIIYSSDNSGTPARLGIGTSGNVLTVSAGSLPAWSAPTGTILIATNSGGNLANNDFLEQGGSQVSAANESDAQIVVTRTGTLKNLYVNLTVAPSLGTSRTFTVRVNGLNTLLSVTLTSGVTQNFDATDKIAVGAFDLISIQQTSSGAPSAAVGMASFELAY